MLERKGKEAMWWLQSVREDSSRGQGQGGTAWGVCHFDGAWKAFVRTLVPTLSEVKPL